MDELTLEKYRRELEKKNRKLEARRRKELRETSENAQAIVQMMFAQWYQTVYAPQMSAAIERNEARIRSATTIDELVAARAAREKLPVPNPTWEEYALSMKDELIARLVSKLDEPES